MTCWCILKGESESLILPPDVLNLVIEFLESAFAEFGNGILGRCSPNFATQKVVKLGTNLITIYFNPRLAVASSMEVGWASTKASKLNKQFLIPDEWTYSSGLRGSPVAIKTLDLERIHTG
jgi:hypothetical protein